MFSSWMLSTRWGQKRLLARFLAARSDQKKIPLSLLERHKILLHVLGNPHFFAGFSLEETLIFLYQDSPSVEDLRDLHRGHRLGRVESGAYPFDLGLVLAGLLQGTSGRERAKLHRRLQSVGLTQHLWNLQRPELERELVFHQRLAWGFPDHGEAYADLWETTQGLTQTQEEIFWTLLVTGEYGPDIPQLLEAARNL